MALNNSTQNITNNLIFHLDVANTKSYKGAPLTNYAYDQNPRTSDLTYAVYSATSSGTWNAKHPDAIRVYNAAGSELSGYSNTGVTDWTNTYHAIWTYDYELDKPVVTMRDYDGQWKAKSWSMGQTYASMGLSAGSTYTISWLQWTSDVSKSANAGLYSNIGFGDGQSNAQGTSYNTKINTWQRVYATFTVNGTSNLASGLSCYMYGMYGPLGVLRIADVQIELGSVANGFNNGQTRSSTQALIDLTGTHTIPPTSLTYLSNGTFSFNGSSNKITGSVAAGYTSSFNSISRTWEVVVRPGASMTNAGIFGHVTSAGCSYYCNGGIAIYGGKYVFNWYDNAAYQFLDSGVSAVNGQYAHVIGTYSSTDNKCRIYVNGQLKATSGATNMSYGSSSVEFELGYWCASGLPYTGTINVAKYYYAKELSAYEAQQNFNGLRGRFGL